MSRSVGARRARCDSTGAVRRDARASSRGRAVGRRAGAWTGARAVSVASVLGSFNLDLGLVVPARLGIPAGRAVRAGLGVPARLAVRAGRGVPAGLVVALGREGG